MIFVDLLSSKETPQPLNSYIVSSISIFLIAQ